MLVPLVLASTLASPLAWGAALVPRNITLVDPPPTSYPTALIDLLTTSAAGISFLFCAFARPTTATRTASAQNRVHLEMFILSPLLRHRYSVLCIPPRKPNAHGIF